MPNKYEKYYRILDLDVGTSKENVKKAFRELSHIWHPDNHMGKSSNVQNRATEKFKEISNAYQVLKEHLSTEDKRVNEQDRREREGEERKQREENERRKREEESKRRNEQDRREREEKENKYWEEQAKKKHEEEKCKQRNKEHIFVGCPECETKIIINTTENNWRVCTCCGHLYHYFFEDGKLKVVRDSNQNFPAKTVKVPSKESDFRWGRVLLGVVFGFVLMFLLLGLFSSVYEGTDDSRKDADFELIFKVKQLANLRNKPNIKKSTVIYVLKRDTQIKVLKQKEQWAEVQTELQPGGQTITGWLHSTLIYTEIN